MFPGSGATNRTGPVAGVQRRGSLSRGCQPPLRRVRSSRVLHPGSALGNCESIYPARAVGSPKGGANRPGEPTISERRPEFDPAAASHPGGSAGTPRPTGGSRTAWRHPQARSSLEGRANRPGEPPVAGRGLELDPAAAIRADGSAGTPRPTGGSRTAWRHPQARSSLEGRANRPGEPTVAERGPEFNMTAAIREAVRRGRLALPAAVEGRGDIPGTFREIRVSSVRTPGYRHGLNTD